jgi:hypothetical protein
MCPAEPIAGAAGTPVAPNARPKLTIGMTVADQPIVIPEEFTLRIYAPHASSFSAQDRFTGEWTSEGITAGYSDNFPYWNGAELETTAVNFWAPWIDFDGRTFSSVTPNTELPFAFFLTDPTEKAP